MKYNKIRGLPLEICTCEQKISYNLALWLRQIIKQKYDLAETGIQRSDVIRYFVNFLIKEYTRDNPNGKYDIDSIFCALGAGLEKYINHNYAILDSYKEIGEMFPAKYLKK